MARSNPTAQPVAKRTSSHEIYAIVFGLFLGLAIVKFGNPAILDKVIFIPKTSSDLWADAWPLRWANWLLLVLVLFAAPLVLLSRSRWPGTRWLWILPVVWFAWQFVSATHTVDSALTKATLWQLGGCVACYFLGALVIGRERGWRFVMMGLLAAFALCLVRAVNQKIEFPHDRQFLQESERAGFTNMPPAVFEQMKRENVIISTNGVDIVNPLLMAKYEKGRVNGTLVYPNALAGIVLLLLPIGLVAVWQGTRKLRPATRTAAIALVVFLGAAGLYGSGSKGGWLLAVAMGVVWLLRLNWSQRLKWLTVLALVLGGLVVFGLRFQSYFAKGATSVGARFDYWRVAARVTAENPLLGSGPGTFQRPYSQLKKPESEMARLVHNDYLEQFSDSGIVGGLSYLVWIALLLWVVGRRIWSNAGWLEFAIFVGLLGWFVQGIMEFSLYVPALAWTAFTLGGCLLRHTANQFDKPNPAH